LGGAPAEPAPRLAQAKEESLASVYRRAAEAADCRANHLVVRSILESEEAGPETFSIEAPGCHPTTFTSRLGDADMAVFAQVFSIPAQRFLVRLDLSNNLITDVGAERLAQLLLCPSASRLESLALQANSIGPHGCNVLCQALRHCMVLSRLDLSRNPLGRAGGFAVVELMTSSPSLLELNVADAEIDINALVAISTSLLSGVPKLKVCNIENPRLSTLQEEHTVHLGRMLRVNTSLREMYLGKLMMRDEGVRQLVSFLIENKTLRVLDLRCNELGASGAAHLGVLLADDCQLSSLNLASNRIGEKASTVGARALAEALLRNRMLRHLDLNHNELCGPALQLLGEALDQNSTLETLALFHNDWDQPSSFKFHQVLNDRARILPLHADFVTGQVDLRIDVCELPSFRQGPR